MTAVMAASLMLVSPSTVSAFCYVQSSYYSQSSYYTQSTYQTNITGPSKVWGTLSVTGALSKGSGTFVIDHPLDPRNMLLYHSFVESPDVKNLYDGVATLDAAGQAIVTLPPYFDALNTRLRFQVSPQNTAMPDLFMHDGYEPNTAVIEGGVPGGTVSWQITGIRKDDYILANPIIPEVDKGPNTLVPKGEYLHPIGPSSWWEWVVSFVVPTI